MKEYGKGINEARRIVEQEPFPEHLKADFIRDIDMLESEAAAMAKADAALRGLLGRLEDAIVSEASGMLGSTERARELANRVLDALMIPRQRDDAEADRRERLEMENTEYDWGHDVRHGAETPEI